ncbi:hypothetical protein GXB85_16465 [Cellulomonas sp. APG4]|uniref:hypothetical protein n=1 Tax=Cellulomonas sp. APG4 TaxID=1538656 RepID=UPI001379C1B5|nr:hypothetical protein [Cellulomonas sp. APG4]NCT92531.1 hypothetical protein [Cellulomonas sp. APG4]
MRLRAVRPRTVVRTVLAGALVGVLAASAAVGHAARLPLAPASLTSVTVAERCADAIAVTAPATTTATVVRLTVPQECVGSEARLRLVGTAGPLAQDDVVAGLPAAGAVDVPVPAYAPAAVVGVALTLDGWGVVATWTWTPPVAGPAITCWTSDPARPCTATATVRGGNVWSTGYDLDITVRDARTGNANNPVEWTIRIDFSHSRYPWVPTSAFGSGVVRQSSCADLPVLTLAGQTGWGDHHTLRKGDVRSVWVQPRNDGAGGLLSCG